LGKGSEDGEYQLSLWGRGVNVLLEGDEVYAEVSELVEGIDEGLGRAGESVVSPDEDDVHLSLSGVVEEALVVGSVFVGACGVVYILICYFKPSTLCILSELEELGFGVLAFVEGGDSGVDGNAFCGGGGHVQKVLLLDMVRQGLKTLCFGDKIGVDLDTLLDTPTFTVGEEFEDD